MQMTDKGYCICGGALQLWQTKNVERKQKMSNANKKCQTQTIITTSEMK